MQWNFTQDKQNINKSPEYEVSYGSDIPALRAKDNISYLEFIDVLEKLWSDSNPEIRFLPYSANEKFDPEKGYIIYSLEKKVAMSDTPRMKLHTIEDHPSDSSKKIAVFRQSFHIIINFTAMHGHARTAEEIIEEFENFMLKVKFVFQKLGIQGLEYHGRTRDQHESRIGQDMESRNSMYSIIVQKIEIIELDKIDQLVIQVQTLFEREQATPNSTSDVNVDFVDHYTNLNS